MRVVEESHLYTLEAEDKLFMPYVTEVKQRGNQGNSWVCAANIYRRFNDIRIEADGATHQEADNNLAKLYASYHELPKGSVKAVYWKWASRTEYEI